MRQFSPPALYFTLQGENDGSDGCSSHSQESPHRQEGTGAGQETSSTVTSTVATVLSVTVTSPDQIGPVRSLVTEPSAGEKTVCEGTSLVSSSKPLPGVISIAVVSPANWSAVDTVVVSLQGVVSLILIRLLVEGRETALSVGVFLIVVLLRIDGRFQLTLGHSDKICHFLVAVRH